MFRLPVVETILLEASLLSVGARLAGDGDRSAAIAGKPGSYSELLAARSHTAI
jgi:hypothetical protein